MNKAIIALALVLTGCTTAPHVVTTDPREAIAVAVAKCATAIERIASTGQGDAASKVAAVGAIERLCGNGGANMQFSMQPLVQQQPPSLGQTLWTAALQTADIFLRGYGIRASRDVSINGANNATATAIAGYSAFGSIASAGLNSNAAIASHIQAPGAITTNNITTTTNTTTNTNTLSGAGLIGSGSYTGPYTGPVTRQCQGGQGGQGNTGAGGGAQGGSC